MLSRRIIHRTPGETPGTTPGSRADARAAREDGPLVGRVRGKVILLAALVICSARRCCSMPARCWSRASGYSGGQLRAPRPPHGAAAHVAVERRGHDRDRRLPASAAGPGRRPQPRPYRPRRARGIAGRARRRPSAGTRGISRSPGHGLCRSVPSDALAFPCLAVGRDLGQSEEHHFLPGNGADVVVQAPHLDRGHFLDHRLHERACGLH